MKQAVDDVMELRNMAMKGVALVVGESGKRHLGRIFELLIYSSPVSCKF